MKEHFDEKEIENEKEEEIEDFRLYPTSDDDQTKIIDGKKNIASFRLYKNKREQKNKEGWITF